MRAPVAAAIVAAAVCAIPTAASAHATLVETSPAGGERLARAPQHVRVVFDDPVQVGPGNEVIRNDGGSMLSGPPAARGRTLVLPIRARLQSGTYTVRWSIISDDGHNELGVFAFSIGLGPVAAPSLRADEPVDSAVVAARWVFFTCLLVAAGLALFDLVVARRAAPTRLFVGAFAGTAVSAGVLIQLSGAGISTRFGAAVLAAAVIAAAGALAALASWRVLAYALAPALLPIPTVAGHALDAGQSWVEIPIDLLHVTAVAFWLGSLVALAATRRRDAIMRFSRLAVPTVVLIALTGVGRALAELSSPAQLWTTDYGATLLAKTVLFALLLAKTVLFALLLGLAWVSRASDSASVVRPIRSEAVVLVLVLLAVGVLTAVAPARTQTPPRTAAQREGRTALGRLPAADAVVLGARAGGYVAALAVRPSGEARVNFIAQDTKAVDVGAVTIDGRRTRDCGIGCYVGTAASHGIVSVGNGRRTLHFDLGRPRPAPGVVARLTEAYGQVRGVAYAQTIASGVGTRTDALWTETPNGFSYRLANGNEARVIGPTRWERTRSSPWRRSRASGASELVPPWGTEGTFRNAHVLRRQGSRAVVSFLGANAGYPAWFTVTCDLRTGRVFAVRMIAAAHFMQAHYRQWDVPIVIRPPD